MKSLPPFSARPCLAFACAILLATSAHAQIVADGATNTLSNVTTNITGDVTVGTNGSFTLLVLSNNALLTNSANGIIGLNATAKSNEVRLISASARWRMGGSLYFGSNGAFSRLVVSNGALVENSAGSLARAAASSNNFALVTGGGSVWSNRNGLDIGGAGPNNQMIVSNGGWVASGRGILGREANSSNNLVLVTGSGSVWSNALDLFVGNLTSGNRLVIEAGGLVSCDEGRVGIGNGANNNEVVVTGPGSLWNNRSFTTYIGNGGNFNRLVVSNGAAVRSPAGNVGTGSSSVSNQVVVTGAGSTWSNQALTIGGSAGHRVEVSDGGVISTGKGTVGEFGNNNTVFLRDFGSVWNSQGDLIIGDGGGGNLLVASNGATVLSSNATIGASTSLGNNNLALITGAGTIWSNRHAFTLGDFGGGNQLVVSNGAAVFIGGNGLLGINSGANSNAVVASGAGTSLVVASNLYVGSNGAFSRLIVSNGALVANGIGAIGNDTSSSNNVAVVTGSGSVWSNANDLFVGLNGRGNQLVVSNGGSVFGSNVLVGRFSSNNRVVVDGGTLRATNAGGTSVLEVRGGTNVLNAGLIDVDRLVLTNAQGQFEFNGGTLVSRGVFITNGADMIVGASGSSPAVWDVRAGVSNHFCNLGVIVGFNTAFHQLLVTDGALLTNGIGGFIGLSTGANSNQARISGSGSQWRTSGDLFVGSGGSFNTLVVSNGALVENNKGSLARTAASSNNFALVTGGGSVWSNRNGLDIGGAGPNNQMIVSNGGWVASGRGILGREANSSNNLVLVTGSGSVWSNALDLFVGNLTSGNRLVIEAGGLVSCDEGRVGIGNGANNNEVVVTGPGSLWNNRSFTTYIGNGGNFNRLVVSNGAAVRSPAGNVGTGSSSVSNQVVVTGAGSTWSNQALTIGGSAGHRVEVSDGGVISTGKGTVGEFGNNNTVFLRDFGSVWNSQGDLIIGDGGGGNLLVASNGATVLSSNATIGASTSLGNNNLALITGAGTIWSNRHAFTLGDFGGGNQLVVSNGAAVFIGGNGLLGINSGANSNAVVASGAGTSLVVASNLYVGSNGAFSRLIVSNGGSVFGGNVVIGATTSSINNRVVMDGGILRATNAAGTGILDVRRGTNVLNAGLMDTDQLLLTNRGTIAIHSMFGNSSSNHIPVSGTASAYPSTIAVPGLAGLVTNVSVTLSNLSEGFAHNLDILLVNPAGQKVMLMSDAGGFSTLSNVRLTFDDSAATSLPESNNIPTGTYRPTDYEPGETLPSPAPGGPYVTTLSSFNGSDPNGVWSLYILHDDTAFEGSLVGWGLQITTDRLFFDPGGFEFNGGTLVTRGASINNGQPFVVGGPGGIPAVWDVHAGANSHLVNHDLIVGGNSSFNQLLVTNGASLTNVCVGIIGDAAGANANLASISGAGSQWRMSGDVIVGNFGSGNRLVIGTGGVVSPGANAIVGAVPAISINNLLHVAGGTLRVLNPGNMLDVRGGTNRLDAGLVDVNRLVVTNTRGHFEFNGGTLRTPDTTVANGRVFTVGNGASSATLQLIGGTHTFSNNLVVASNASLIGNGVIDGIITVAAGGKLIPGAPIGRISALDTVILRGAVNLQIDKSGAALTNDQVQSSGALIYGGTLTVTDIGTDALAASDRFPLFSASTFASAFATISLPPLGPGLSWANNLLVDGSIEVIAVAVSQPKFGSITVSGTNVILSGTNGTAGANYAVLAATNVSQPLSNWVSIATNQFGSGGNFSFTNGIALGDPQRFFRIRTP